MRTQCTYQLWDGFDASNLNNARSRTRTIHGTIVRTIIRMDLELTQIALLLDGKDLSGEQLDRISDQVAEITYQKDHILGLLHQCTAENGEQFY
jgi:hypothetical protein